MYDVEVEIGNVSLNWKFPFMISQLPSLNNKETFDYLIKSLRPLGLTARSINLESPNNNLDDVAMVINLLNHKFTVRITFSGFEAEGRDIYVDEALQILNILGVIFNTLEQIDPEIKKGFGVVRIGLHLSFLEGNFEDYISEIVSTKINGENITPEAVLIPLVFDKFTKDYPTKVMLAKSLAIENGLFLDINYQSGKDEQELKVDEPIELLEMMAEHYQTLFSRLNLNVPLNEVN